MPHFVCVAVFFAAALDGAAPPAITLAQALDRAEQHSPLVRRARADLNLVTASKVGAAVLIPYNPAISAALGARRDNSGSMPPANGFEWALRVEQTLEVAGQRGTRMKEAEAATRGAAARLKLAVIETRARARAAYVGAVLSQSAADSARRREELGRRIYDSARARVQAGAASDVELHLAEVERGRLTAQRIEADIEVHDALAQLSRMVGQAARPASALGSPEINNTPAAELIERARRQRADLLALDERRSELDAQLVRLRREVVPNPTLFVDVAAAQPGQLYVGGGIGLPLPVWQRNQGPLAMARAMGDSIAVERELLEREIALEVSRGERTVRARSEEAALFEKEIVPAAEANVGLVEEGWRAGKFDLYRVIAAAREAGDARRTQLERLGALWQAAIELDRATGTP